MIRVLRVSPAFHTAGNMIALALKTRGHSWTLVAFRGLLIAVSWTFMDIHSPLSHNYGFLGFSPRARGLFFEN